MQQFMNNLSVWTQGFLWGFGAFPVSYYFASRFGGAVWEDIKKIAYGVWNKVKAEV